MNGLKGLKSMKIKTKLSLLVGVFVLVFVLFGVLAFDTLNTLKVNGPYYKQVVLGKDLVADILPPPEYILESYLVAYQMADPANRTFLAGLEQKSQVLRREYETRHEFWLANLPESTPSEKQLKQAMGTDSYQPALRFLNLFQKEFLPAVQRNDYPTAAQLLHGPLQQNYEEHRTAIDQVVVMTNTRNQVIEAEANRVIAARLVLLAVLGIAMVLGMALGIARFLNHSIAAALQAAASTPASPALETAPASEAHAQTSQIETITNLVNGLANQTNILALNAAVEAARTSEQARGFSMVAAEIRNLADENRNLVARIHTLVENIQSANNSTVMAIEKGTENVQ